MIEKYYQAAGKLSDLPLLLIRLILAYGFYNPAMMKLRDINSIADWFSSINIPFPLVNAYLAAGTEISGVVLLTLGLFTRIISIPLMVTMVVAIVTVHWGNGFEAGDNGFEIPLYYLILLFTLIVYGSGRISLDHILFRKNK
ncbi:HvfX family Cu-binding RiPP maturation protein [Chryseobacterium cheonjiense]|uniref:DoxX family protein n=1 Tax=Chryseobacterium cheonjiense TaxID=2728845 RepID=A0A7Y0FI50_9FLAO|nr:DoxX family protein [Chryseobacterium cheonjiense]NML57128.1 DoxX family protein [Chryseobacterium cheonjiense]